MHALIRSHATDPVARKVADVQIPQCIEGQAIARSEAAREHLRRATLGRERDQIARLRIDNQQAPHWLIESTFGIDEHAIGPPQRILIPSVQKNAPVPLRVGLEDDTSDAVGHKKIAVGVRRHIITKTARRRETPLEPERRFSLPPSGLR